MARGTVEPRGVGMSEWMHRIVGMREIVDGECFYCGDLADTVDHCVPRVHREKLEATMDPISWRAYVLRMPDVVPCCRDCNTRKASKVFDSIPAICSHLEDALVRRHGRLLKAPHWSEADLQELGPALRDDVNTQIQLAAHVRRRLSHMRRRSSRSGDSVTSLALRAESTPAGTEA